MLKSLTISNYALIKQAEIGFTPGFNIITGETGAGKSILIGALSLVLGARADARLLTNPTNKCVVEAKFSILSANFKTFFENNELDFEDETILRREIAANGKSRAFINDTPVNITVLKALAEQLIDVISQHQTLQLNSPEFQLEVIDTFAHTIVEANNLQTKVEQIKKLKQKQTELENILAAKSKEVDYQQFLLQELIQANLNDANELNDIEKELDQLNNAEDIKQKINTLYELLEVNDTAILATLKISIQQLQSIQKVFSPANDWVERLNAVLIELKELSREAQAEDQQVQYDAARISELQDRLSGLYKLLQKHKALNLGELIDLQAQLTAGFEDTSSQQIELEKLKKQLQLGKQEVDVLANQLSEKRISIFKEMENKLQNSFEEVGLPDAKIIVSNQKNTEIRAGKNGFDQISFLFAANKGSTPVEIGKVASGGELSRVMLCVKALLAGQMALPALIFDEIDTGISGEVANKVGNLMRKMAKEMQIIAISHLPQVAAKANHHLFVYKSPDEDVAASKIKQLNPNERTFHLAQMLSGDNPSENAIANAKDLMAE